MNTTHYKLVILKLFNKSSLSRISEVLTEQLYPSPPPHPPTDDK